MHKDFAIYLKNILLKIFEYKILHVRDCLPYCKQTLTCKILQSAKFTNVQKAFF